MNVAYHSDPGSFEFELADAEFASATREAFVALMADEIVVNRIDPNSIGSVVLALTRGGFRAKMVEKLVDDVVRLAKERMAQANATPRWFVEAC